MKTNYIVLDRLTFEIVDSAKSYCKKIRTHLLDESPYVVYFIPTIQGTQALAHINKVNNTNF